MTTAQAYHSMPRSPAPWAEIVPGSGSVTVDVLLTLPDDGYIHEVVEWVLVRVAGSGKQATRLAARVLMPIPFAPDLAVGVSSPSQTATQMAAKARVYLRAGTRLVWIVWPQSAHIDVWHVDVLTGPVTCLTLSDILTGEDVVAGFSYAVAGLFVDPLRSEP